MSQLLAVDVLTTGGGTIYAQGGAILEIDDGLNSLSPARRNAAFLMTVNDEAIRDQYFSIFYGGLEAGTDDFPGSSCHNHALIYEMGPLKANYSKSCPMDWPQVEREEKCISQNEAAWGTANLKRLEAFKAQIDPNNIFLCTSGVGYNNPAPAPPAGMPTPAPVSSPTAPTAAPSIADTTSRCCSWMSSNRIILVVAAMALYSTLS